MSVPSLVGAFATGKNIAVFGLGSTTIDGSGNLTAGTVTSLLGYLDSADFNFEIGMDEISPAAGNMRNMVPIKGTFDGTVSLITAANGNSPLMDAMFAGTGGAMTGSYVFLTTSNLSSLSGAIAGKALGLYAFLSGVSTNRVEGKSLTSGRLSPVGVQPNFA